MILLQADAMSGWKEHLKAHVDGYAATAASASFTLMGFLVAALSLIGAVRPEFWQHYKERGMLFVYRVVLAEAVIALGVAFVLSMTLFFFPHNHGIIVASAVALTVGCTATVLACVPPLRMLGRQR